MRENVSLNVFRILAIESHRATNIKRVLLLIRPEKKSKTKTKTFSDKQNKYSKNLV